MKAEEVEPPIELTIPPIQGSLWWWGVEHQTEPTAPWWEEEKAKQICKR